MTLTWATPQPLIAPVLAAWPTAAQSLAFWAFKTCEGLHYLADVDDYTFKKKAWLGHHPDTASDFLVKAATAGAITALDQCAAAIARRQVGAPQRDNEASVRDLQPFANTGSKFAAGRVPHRVLSAEARAWATGLWGDSRYHVVRALRNPLTHAALRRTLYGATAGAALPPHSLRPAFTASVGPVTGLVQARDAVSTAVAVATVHVERFRAAIASGRL
jgi:hypothetical protein